MRGFLRDAYERDPPDSDDEMTTLLRNLNLALPSGQLNLAGLLLLGDAPQRYLPQFVLKAVSYPGTEVHPTTYLDSEDFEGPLPAIFDGAMAFVVRNLHRVQGTGGVNAPGRLEIPRIVFEELLVNALVHRDYLVSAPIRLFLYDDRIEIISPGHLPNNLTVESIRAGIAIIRNPAMDSAPESAGRLPRGRRSNLLTIGIETSFPRWCIAPLGTDSRLPSRSFRNHNDTAHPAMSS